jgi:ankyrin repeat protein
MSELTKKEVNELLLKTISYGAYHETKELIEAGADVNYKGGWGLYPLNLAAINDHADICELLIKHKADIHCRDKDGSTPLHNAAERGHYKSSLALLSAGASVCFIDNEGNTPFLLSPYGNDPQTCELLLNAKSDPNTKNRHYWNAFHTLADCSAFNKEIGNILLKAGVDLHFKDSDGITPLSMAKIANNKPAYNFFSSAIKNKIKERANKKIQEGIEI